MAVTMAVTMAVMMAKAVAGLAGRIRKGGRVLEENRHSKESS
jgi:hypothetical protein